VIKGDIGREEDEEGDTGVKTTRGRGGTGGAAKEGGHIFWALMIVTPMLNKGVTMVDGGAMIRGAKELAS